MGSAGNTLAIDGQTHRFFRLLFTWLIITVVALETNVNYCFHSIYGENVKLNLWIDKVTCMISATILAELNSAHNGFHEGWDY